MESRRGSDERGRTRRSMSNGELEMRSGGAGQRGLENDHRKRWESHSRCNGGCASPLVWEYAGRCVEESRGGCVEREIVARRSAVLGGVESASVLSRSDSLAGAGGGKPNGGEHSG